jgi:uncharacterized phage-associated protein
MISFNLQKDKAVNSLLYVVNILGKVDKHKVAKILYFADQKHLVKYGRPIIGDTYIKMNFGPVPSYILNIMNNELGEISKVIVVVDKYNLKALQTVDLDQLSESEIECLNESITENKDLDFDTLTKKSHDYAYNKASWTIDFLDMARALKAGDEMLSYINQQMINDSIVFE